MKTLITALCLISLVACGRSSSIPDTILRTAFPPVVLLPPALAADDDMPENYIHGDPIILPDLEGGPDPTDDLMLYQEAVTGEMKRTAMPTGTVGGNGTNNNVARWDGTDDIQGSNWTLNDSGFMEALVDSGFLPPLLEATWFSESFPAFAISHHGGLGWGDGSAAADTTLVRAGADRLQLGAGDAFTVQGQAGDHADVTQGTISYDTTTDKFRLNENTFYVYPDNMKPIVLPGDAAVSIAVTDRLIVFATTLSATRAATLPLLTSVPDGTQITIKDLGGINGANIINITPTGPNKIDGVNAAYPMGVALMSVTVVKVSNALGWAVI